MYTAEYVESVVPRHLPPTGLHQKACAGASRCWARRPAGPPLLALAPPPGSIATLSPPPSRAAAAAASSSLHTPPCSLSLSPRPKALKQPLPLPSNPLQPRQIGYHAIQAVRGAFDWLTDYGPGRMTEEKWLQRMIFLGALALALGAGR